MGTPSSDSLQCSQHVFRISSFLPDLCWDCLVLGHHGHRGGEEEGQGGEESPTDPSRKSTTTRREKEEKKSMKPDCSPRPQSWKRTSSWLRSLLDIFIKLDIGKELCLTFVLNFKLMECFA